MMSGRDAFTSVCALLAKSSFVVDQAKHRTAETAMVNKEQPVFWIPAGILLKIFRILATDPIMGRYISCPEWTCQIPWIRVTHVCQHWREVALACGSLWSNLSYMSPGCMELAVTRAGDTPLSVAFKCSRQTLTTVARRVIAQNQRLRSLHLDDCVPRQLVQVLPLLSKSAPHLDDLVISCLDDPGVDFSPDLLFGGAAPALEQIHLERCSIPWRKVPFSNVLTHLFLLDDSKGMMRSSYRPSHEAFMEVLRNAPLIKVLHLYQMLPLATVLDPSATSGSSRLTLYALEDLKLRDSARCIGGFLASCFLPKATQIHLDFKEPTLLTSTTLGLVFGNLRDAWSGYSQHSAASPTILGFEKMYLNAMSCRDPDEDFSMDQEFLSLRFGPGRASSVKGSAPRLSLTFRSDVPPLEMMFASFCSFPALLDFKFMDLGYGQIPLSITAWGLLGRSAKSLQTIEFTEGGTSAVATLFQAFVANPDAETTLNEEDGSMVWIFPSLSLVKCSELYDWEKYNQVICAAVRQTARSRSDGRATLELRIDEECEGFSFPDYVSLLPFCTKIRIVWAGYYPGAEADDDEEDEDEYGDDYEDEDGDEGEDESD